jgi:gliding motility-associated-like protein
LSWSPYRKWRNDVQRYEIEVFNELTQAFEYVDAVNGNVLKYMDRKTQFNQPYYCYRIRAVESGGLQETAFSNEDCVIFGPAIFAPNAFSPNGDGINDEFLLKGPNVEQVEFLVFDRWGELVFEADNLLDGWDGTYKGRAAQEGVYVFVFRGTGYDGTKLERSGTITLIR